LKQEYKQIFDTARSREEFVGTLLLEDWNMPRATAVTLWNKLSKDVKKEASKKKEQPKEVTMVSMHQDPKRIFPVADHFPLDEKEAPRSFKWMEFKDMCRFNNTRDKLTRDQLTRYGFTTLEINWLIDNGYIKYDYGGNK
jgi:hypothetical protein